MVGLDRWMDGMLIGRWVYFSLFLILCYFRGGCCRECGSLILQLRDLPERKRSIYVSYDAIS